MKIFIDDYRMPADKHSSTGWVICRTYVDFESCVKQLLDRQTEWIEEISFDYDLRDINDGIDCAKLLVRTILAYGLDVPKIYVHSEFPSAEKKFLVQANTLSRRLLTNIIVYHITESGKIRELNSITLS